MASAIHIQTIHRNTRNNLTSLSFLPFSFFVYFSVFPPPLTYPIAESFKDTVRRQLKFATLGQKRPLK